MSPVFSKALLNGFAGPTGYWERTPYPVHSLINKCKCVSSTCVLIYIFVFASSTCWYMLIVICYIIIQLIHEFIHSSSILKLKFSTKPFVRCRRRYKVSWKIITAFKQFKTWEDHIFTGNPEPQISFNFGDTLAK